MKQISIAICEDEKSVLAYLHKQIIQAFEASEIPCSIDCFSNGRDLLRTALANTPYQVLFLDIEMPGMNGIEICRKLRDLHYETLVIFVSNKEELVFQTFEVQPFRFIRKNHFLEELPGVIRGVKKELATHKGTCLTIKERHGNSICTVNIYEILYIEVTGKYCHIVTTTRTQKIRYNLSDLEKDLQPHGFLKPHRSYLVNYRYIYDIKNDYLLLDDDTQIPISRNRVKEIRFQFMNAIRSE